MKLANDVKTFCYSLFDEYRNMYSSLVPQSAQSGDSMSVDLEDNGIGGGVDYMKSLKDRAKRLKGSGGYVRSEFKRYLNEQLGVEEEDMDAISWWGINGHRYPIVSRMAHDISAIPLSTFASESAFSAGGRHLDQFRSSLTPKTVQALICSQDWIRARERIVVAIDMEENVKELEKDIQSPAVEDEVFFVDSLF